MMSTNQLREELKIDEGVKYEIYLDHLGYPTFGIGHLVRSTDPESGCEVGTSVTEHRVNEAFDEDIKTVLEDCERLYPFSFFDLPEEVQLIIANMMFNMGYSRLSKFVGMHQAVEAKDWNTAADEMVDSRWYRQVPNRAKRLVERMKNVTTTSVLDVNGGWA